MLMIMPPGHAEAIAARRRLSRREQWMVGGVLGATAAVILILVISLGSAGRSSAHGCIYATIPGAVGAQEIYQCGADARATCATALAPRAFTAQAAQTVAADCRRAGLPVGR